MRLRPFILCFYRTAFPILKSGLKSSVFCPNPFPQISPKSYRHNAVSNRFLALFSTFRTNGSRLLSWAKAGTHATPALNRAHSGLHAETWAFRMGVVSLPSIRAARSRISPGRVSERQTLPLFSLGREVLSKNAESLRNSDALMRVAVPRCRGPAGLRDLFLFLPKLRLLRSAHTGPFRVCEAGVVSLPSARFARCRNAGRPLVKVVYLPFSCVPY